MSEGLCWKCEEAATRYYSFGGIPCFTHCHHDEPKEKPKCWCERHGFPSSRKYMKLGEEAIEINFCPECGKKL